MAIGDLNTSNIFDHPWFWVIFIILAVIAAQISMVLTGMNKKIGITCYRLTALMIVAVLLAAGKFFWAGAVAAGAFFHMFFRPWLEKMMVQYGDIDILAIFKRRK